MARSKKATSAAVQNKALIISGELNKNLSVKTIININGIKADMVAQYQALALQFAIDEANGVKAVKADKKPLQTKINAFGNSKGYGDKYPKAGTSAYAIWQACENISVTVDTITKFAVYDLSGLSLMYGVAGEKPVNYANLSIEVNSYKKYLRNQA